jgi:hypothetical protein
MVPPHRASFISELTRTNRSILQNRTTRFPAERGGRRGRKVGRDKRRTVSTGSEGAAVAPCRRRRPARLVVAPAKEGYS